MKYLIFLMSLAAACLARAVTPQPPMTVELAKDGITVVELHPEIQTLLHFPDVISHLSGHGLTDGQYSGKIIYQIGQEGEILILKPQVSDFSVFVSFMLDGDAYVMQLKDSETPATLARLVYGLPSPEALPKEIEKHQAEHLFQRPSVIRQKELIRLAVSEPHLRPEEPSLYQHYTSRVATAKYTDNHFEIEIDRVGKFSTEDVLVVMGRITHLEGKTLIQHGAQLRLIIGDSPMREFDNLMVYPFPNAAHEGEQSLEYCGILIGDGNGGPGHFGLSNSFKLVIENNKIVSYASEQP